MIRTFLDALKFALHGIQLGLLLRQLLLSSVVFPTFRLGFLAFLVVIDGQFFQSLQDILDFVFSRIIFTLDFAHFFGQILVITATGSNQFFLLQHLFFELFNQLTLLLNLIVFSVQKLVHPLTFLF